jgi:tetratricopeptide (TPR) repeat protein/TolB-like protein
MNGTTISHYKIMDKVGEGGMGVVYKAQDTKLDRTVALKFLSKHLLSDQDAKMRFINEAKAASALDHPNIATIYEIDEDQGECFISMAYVDGKSVKDLIKDGELEGWDTSKIVDVGIQIAKGLSEAHCKGVIHRDIKSHNIMLTGKGLVKITDFGLAKLKGADQRTRPGSMLGTIAYMSPEQARGEEVDCRADVWALGVVLYEMLTGKMPFKGDHDEAVRHSILNKEPDPITEEAKEGSEGLRTIVMRALQKDPSHRYQNVDEMLVDLQAVKNGLPVTEGLRIKARGLGITRKHVPLFGAVVILVLTLLVLFGRHRENGTPSQIFKIPVGVMFFDNQTGEDKYNYLRKVLADMLITDLGQSKYLEVITFERMFELLRSMGYEDTEIIDASLGLELCKLAGAQVMVLGSLTKSGETFVINTQLLDTQTKEQMAACRVKDEGETSILGHMVDKLSDEIKGKMEVSAKEIQQEEKNLTEFTTNSLEAYRYYSAGREAAHNKHHQEAIDNFEKAIALDSAFTEAYVRLARQYYETKENTQALEILETAKSCSPELSEDKLIEILALEAYIKHDWDLAISFFKELTSKNPENIRAHIDLGMVYYRGKGMYNEGISEFKKAIELDPRGVTEFSFAYNGLGWVYLRKGELEKAREAFERYVAQLPNQAAPLISLGDFHLIVGNYDQAETNLKRAADIEPDFSLTSDLLGETYLETGRYNQALRSYERCILLAPNQTEQAEAHFRIGRLHYFKGENAQALQECQRALELDPKMIEAHWVQGLTFIKQGRLNLGESEASIISGLIEEMKAEDLEPYRYHLEGEVLLAKGLTQRSLNNFKKAANASSLDRALFGSALGEAYLKTCQWDQAAEELEAVFEINPHYAQAHYLLGLVYEKQGKKEKARQHFQKFVEIWKEADEDLAQLTDARKRLQEL